MHAVKQAGARTCIELRVVCCCRVSHGRSSGCLLATHTCVIQCFTRTPMVLAMFPAGRPSVVWGCVVHRREQLNRRCAIRDSWSRFTTQRCTVAPAASLEPPGLQIGCTRGCQLRKHCAAWVCLASYRLHRSDSPPQPRLRTLAAPFLASLPLAPSPCLARRGPARS